MKRILRGIALLTLLGTFSGTMKAQGISSQWIAMNKFGDTGNGELQCYLPSQDTESGGMLVVATILKSVTCAGKSSSYDSGMVTWATFSYTYGTLEFRAKMAGGQGTWPAIWLLGRNCQPMNAAWSATVGNCNWPLPGSDEIDVTEILNSSHGSINQQLHSNGHNDGCTASASDTSQNFHVYQLVWAPGSLKWNVDGKTTCTLAASYAPNTPMFLIINTAMGGAGGSVSNSTLPQQTQVDYVKVTQGSTVVFDDEFGGAVVVEPPTNLKVTVN